jgi:hypothetical protein
LGDAGQECGRSFSFHGVGVTVAASSDEILQAIEHDFSYFLASPGEEGLRLTLHDEKPDYDNLPAMTASGATPRNICYQSGDTTYIDYFGRALNVYNHHDHSCNIYTDDPDLAHEISYLTILSRVAERLDQMGLHRIHALGLEFRDRAILVLLPSGGGKSTLAMSFLQGQDQGVRLISEDSPLVKRNGALLPFPLRIGVLPQSLPPGIDQKFTRWDRRMEFQPKVSIDIRYFADKIYRGEVRPSRILLGIRSTERDARISPAGRFAVIRHSLMNSIIGIGLYQGMEFIMQKKATDLVAHGGIVFSRMYNNLRLVLGSRIYSFVMGRDVSRNHEVLSRFITSGEAE